MKREALVGLVRDKHRRAIYLTGLSIPGTLGVAGWKAVLIFVAPSLFLIGNLMFTVGVVVAKHVAIRSHGRGVNVSSDDDKCEAARHQRRAYRAIGMIVLVLSLGYLAASVSLLVGRSSSAHYDRPLAIAIATIAFLELAFSTHGAWSARRNKDLLVEAVKLTNLAASFVLLVLTQTAILSFAYSGEATVYNGISAIIFGSLAAMVGLYMLLRPLPSIAATRSTDAYLEVRA